MKKMILIGAILVLALAGTSLMGQATTGTATVGAVVNAVLTVTNNSDINFGSIQATSTPVLDPQGTSTADVGSTNTFGKFTLNGTNGATIVLTYDATASLGNGAAGSMTFTADVASNTADAIGTSTDRASGAAFALDGTSGNVFVYVGGNLGGLTTQEVGTYTTASPWGLSVEYQ